MQSNFSLSLDILRRSQMAELRRSLNQARSALGAYLGALESAIPLPQFEGPNLGQLIADYCAGASEHEDQYPARFADPILLLNLIGYWGGPEFGLIAGRGNGPIFLSIPLHFDRPMLAPDCADLNLSDRLDDLGLYYRIMKRDRFPLSLRAIAGALYDAKSERDQFRPGESWPALIAEFEIDRGNHIPEDRIDSWDRAGLIAGALSAIDSGDKDRIADSLRALFCNQARFIGARSSEGLIGRIRDLGMGISAGY